MFTIRGLCVVLMSVAAVTGVPDGRAAAAEGAAAPRTSQAAATYGVIEGIEPAKAGPADGGAAAGREGTQGGPAARRWVIRVRLDDGRYQGFHQDGGDELRAGDRVQIEIDRLRRVQEQGKAGK